MAIDVFDGYDELLWHVGHDIEIATYGEGARNVAIECVTCGVVLLDYDKPEGDG